MIRGIVFDCFGVLTADLWHEFLDSLPSEVDRNRVADIHREYGAGRISKQESHDAILRIAGKEFTEMEDISSSTIAKNTALLRYIQELAKDYKIGLLSNVGNNWVREEFLNEEEQTLFDAMVLSYEVGHNKPEPIMYTTMCERLNLSPSEILYIDDMQTYCEAAENEGMQGIQYRSFGQCKHDIETALKG